MLDEESARLDVIETVLGIMLKHAPSEVAAAVMKDLRTTTDGARRNRRLKKLAVPALERMDDILAHWSGQPPQLRKLSGARPSGDGDAA